MTKIRGFTGWLFFGLVVLALLVFSNEAQAQQDHTCQGGHNCPDNGDPLSVETVIGGDSPLLIGAGSLGAADIGECLATTQFGIIIFKVQGTKLNKWCAAEYLDRQGKHHEAALMRCSIKEISKIYGKQDCVGAMKIGGQGLNRGQGNELESTLAGLYNQAAQYDEQVQQQQELQQQVEEVAARYTVLLERIERKERADAAAVRKARQRKAEDNVYLRGLVDELKALSQPEGANDLAKADE